MSGLPFLQYLSYYRDQIILRTEQHALFSFYVILGAIVIGLLVAILTYRTRISANFAISTAAVAFTLPSVALFGFLISIYGADLFKSVYPVVVLYALLPILRNGIAGLQSADPAVIDAAPRYGRRPFPDALADPDADRLAGDPGRGPGVEPARRRDRGDRRVRGAVRAWASTASARWTTWARSTPATRRSSASSSPRWWHWSST